MSPCPYSIEHAPRTLPVWEMILEDLGSPPAARVARVLGVGVSTIYRWNSAGQAPRAAQLALYWLTRWGRSAVNAQAVNDAAFASQYFESLKSELAVTRTRLMHVLALNSAGSANDPFAATLFSESQLLGAGGSPPVQTDRLTGQPAER